MSTTLAYKGTESKKSTLARLRQHKAMDQIVQGTYWQGNGDGRGCAVGCLTHDPHGGHATFPERWGVPVQVAYLIDHIFESLPVEKAKEWPLRIMDAIPAGADLSRVYDRWCYWMLTRLAEFAGESWSVVEVMASLFERAGRGDEPGESEWREAAEAARAAWVAEAAWAAWAARVAEAAEAAEAARAARAAEAAWAAWAARVAEAAEAAWAARAARVAEAAEAAWAARAARVAEAAEAAWAAWVAWVAEAAEAAWVAEAAEAAWAAEAAARHAWGGAAADELIRLVKAAGAGA